MKKRKPVNSKQDQPDCKVIVEAIMKELVGLTIDEATRVLRNVHHAIETRAKISG